MCCSCAAAEAKIGGHGEIGEEKGGRGRGAERRKGERDPLKRSINAGSKRGELESMDAEG